ncbi:MAG: hypothetical protein K2M43_00905 [Mycoplasmoidaceae bacterium]|nr:hypothetical protein [Mycoplasmoidaceae bacterium]
MANNGEEEKDEVVRDLIRHYPQLNNDGYRYKFENKPFENVTPYTQDFLSLVPSSDDSYCLYDVTGDIPDVIAKMFPVAKIDQGYHIYDMTQP